MKKIDNQVLTIFGASGDLTARKLIPAVFNLYKGNMLPENFIVLGVGRTDLGNEGFRKKTVFESTFLNTEGISDEQIHEFAEKLQYQSLDTSDQSAFGVLRDRLEKIDEEKGTSIII